MEVKLAWLDWPATDAAGEGREREAGAEGALLDPPRSSRRKPPRLPGAKVTLPPMPLVPPEGPARHHTMEVEMQWVELVDERAGETSSDADAEDGSGPVGERAISGPGTSTRRRRSTAPPRVPPTERSSPDERATARGGRTSSRPERSSERPGRPATLRPSASESDVSRPARSDRPGPATAPSPSNTDGVASRLEPVPIEEAIRPQRKHRKPIPRED